MAHMSRFDADEQDFATGLLSRLEKELKSVEDAMGGPTGSWMPQMTGVHAMLFDALSELRGVVAECEAMSFRDENREHRFGKFEYGL